MKSDCLLQIPSSYCQWINEIYAIPAAGAAAGPFIPPRTADPFNKTGLQTIAVETLAADRQSILLWGDAGMGKTTLVKHLAYSIVTGSCPDSLSGYLPVIVFLNKLWQTVYREKVKNARMGSAGVDLQQVLTGYFRETGCPLDMETVASFLSQGRVLFLLDGLDEIPPQLYGELVDQLSVFLSANQENRFLLTGRPEGIAGRALECFGAFMQGIEYLTDDMIEDFINARFGAAAADFIARVKGDIPSLVFLKTPALLSAACMIYSRGTDIDGAVIDKLAARGLFLTGKPQKSKALLEFLLYMYAEIRQKNAQTFENRCVHQMLSSF